MNGTVVDSARKLFEAEQWPSVDQELWRRTDLARLLPKGFLDDCSKVAVEPCGSKRKLVPSALPEGCAAEVITEGGVPVSLAVNAAAQEAGLNIQWYDSASLPESLERVGNSDLNGAVNRIKSWHWSVIPGALVIHVKAGAVIDGMVLIRERSAEGTVLAIPRIHVDADVSSELTLMWSLESSWDGLLVLNGGFSVMAASNAHVRVCLRQMLHRKATCFLWGDLEAQRDAHIDFVESQIGASVVKTSCQAIMNAEGSDVRLKGLYVSSDNTHFDIGIVQNHNAVRTTSDALYKGVVQPGGRTVFQGLIDVAPKAAKTDAYLTNNNLVLGDGARADSLPQLNILTDDVKCSHGSTTGQLDEKQMFYLLSRGFSTEDARRELVYAFLNEIVDFTLPFAAKILGEDLQYAFGNGD